MNWLEMFVRRAFNKLATPVTCIATRCKCRLGHVLTCSGHIYKSVWHKCWQWEDGKCNGVRVYNEHEEFGASFRDKILIKKVKKPKEIHERKNAVYGDVSPSYYQVTFWSKQFKWGRESIKDDLRSGRPVEASSKEMCQMWRHDSARLSC